MAADVFPTIPLDSIDQKAIRAMVKTMPEPWLNVVLHTLLALAHRLEGDLSLNEDNYILVTKTLDGIRKITKT